MSATPSPTASPTATPTASPTPTATPTAAPTPPAQAINLSTRLLVQGGDNVGIAGFIVTGTEQKQVLIRGVGPSLGGLGVPNPLADPQLELNGTNGFVTVTNNDWMDAPNRQAIIDSGLAPTSNLESAILVSLNPGSYTAIIKGHDAGSGLALVELFDLNPDAASKFGNISTRANVGTGDNIVIAGFILGNNTSADTVVIRGIGPSLAGAGIPNPLSNPMLEVRNASGSVVAVNNDWQDFPPAAQQLLDLGLAPSNSLESGIVKTLQPGAYTALLSGVSGGNGVGLVEVYDNPVAVPTATPCPACTPTPTPPATPTPTPGGGGTPTPTPGGGGTPTPTPGGGGTPTPSPTPGGGGTCTENFDGVTAPAFPAGWVPSAPIPGDGTMWITSTSTPDSPPNHAFVPDQDGISDKVLDRLSVNVQTASAVLTFRNNFDSEMSDGVFWDGGVLEVSSPNISGGDFLDITDSHVGGTITAGGYTGEISGDASNPLAGRLAWSGSSGGYINTIISLGPNVAGQTITLRWRFGTDEAVAAPGWRVDGLSITDATCQ